MDFGSIFSNTAVYLFSPVTIAYALAATGLAVHFGYAGLLNFGMAAFMAIGGYGYAISVLSFGLPWWIGMLIGLCGGALFAVILGIPTLRLRADYLAIATIAAGEIVRLLFTTQLFDEWTNSADGLAQYNGGFRDANPIPPGTYGFGPWTYSANDLWNRVFGVIVLIAAILLVWALMRSPWGRVLKGIREDEDAVRSLGKSSYSYKMQALIIGGVLGGIAGILVVLPASVQPDGFGRPLTFNLWTIMLLGGAATIFGPLLGSIIFFVVRIAIVQIAGEYIPASILNTQQTQWLSWVLIGIALMLLVIFRPQGILGNKKELSFNA